MERTIHVWQAGDGNRETTYLVNEDGVIIKAFGKVKPKDNAGQMLKELS